MNTRFLMILGYLAICVIFIVMITVYLPKPCNGRCSQDENCMNNNCVSIYPCYGKCASNENCISDRCIPISPCNGRCSLNENCLSGRCVPISPCNGKCALNEDCISDKCIPKPCEGKCTDNYRCVDGKCVCNEDRVGDKCQFEKCISPNLVSYDTLCMYGCKSGSCSEGGDCYLRAIDCARKTKCNDFNKNPELTILKQCR